MKPIQLKPGLNAQARDPHQRYPYQRAVEWIEAFRASKARWPTKGNCPASGVEFCAATFCAALKDLKVWEAKDGE